MLKAMSPSVKIKSSFSSLWYAGVSHETLLSTYDEGKYLKSIYLKKI
jgi:hypothetical protein